MYPDFKGGIRVFQTTFCKGLEHYCHAKWLLSSFNVGNNGVVVMGSLGEIGYYHRPLPDIGSGLPSTSLAAFWDDLDATGGNVYFQTFRTFPNRLFIVQWHNRPHVSNIGNVTFQAQLDEAADAVTFMYQDMNFGDPTLNNGASATVGYYGSALFGAMDADGLGQGRNGMGLPTTKQLGCFKEHPR